MPQKREVVIGEKFNKLTILEDLGRRKSESGHTYTYVLVKCECGTEKEMLYADITSGHNKSCGCYNLSQIKERMTTHGKSDTRLYRIWKDMRRRCNNPNRKNYYLYGGRGIRVCEEWDSFDNFYEWSMENGYENYLTIDRIDTNGNYEPDNCRWITRKAQNGNTRKNKEFIAISPSGEEFISKNVREFSRTHKLDRNEVSNCLKGKRDSYKDWNFKLIN